MNKLPLVKPFLPPKKVLINAISEVLYSDYIAEGEAVKEFQRKFSMIIGNPFSLPVSSGTAALHIALILCGVTNNDEVISTALTSEATNISILMTGAKVIFADIDINNGLISPDNIEKCITKNTKAIVVVHYAGMICDMDRINEISIKYNIPVIEDAAHSFLGKYNGKYIGNNSRFTIFSFQAIKHMTTIDGGMLCCTKESDYIKAKRIKWFGLDKDVPRLQNNITQLGYKYNMNNVTATIGIKQLDYLESNVMKYIKNGLYLDEQLKDYSGVKIVKYNNNTSQAYWLYTLLVENREGFIKKLEEQGISASPLHLRNDKHDIFNNKNVLSNLDYFYERMVHIPCGWWMRKKDIDRMISVIKSGW